MSINQNYDLNFKQNNIFNEFEDAFIKTIKDYQNIIFQNSSKQNNLPIFSLKISSLNDFYLKKFYDSIKFFNKYINQMSLNNLKKNNIPFLTYYEKGEIRILNLIKNLFNAQVKIKLNEENEELKIKIENNSDLYRIMSIIQKDKELTAYLYLLNWIQEIELIKYKNNLSKDFKSIIDDKEKIELTEIMNSLDFDEINYKNSEKYNKFLIQLSNLIIRGNLIEAQNKASDRKLYYITSCLNGGLPLCDFAQEQNFQNFDKDLLPPYFKNLDFDESLHFIFGENENFNKIEIVGNNNWTMWLSALYDTCNDNNINIYFRLICRLLSGNNNNYFITKENVDEYFYINFLNLFNAKLFNILFHSKEKINYYFSPDNKSEYEKFFKNNRINNVFEFINNIRNESEYNSILKENFTLEIELKIIELFFYKINDLNLFYENLMKFYNELYNKINLNQIPFFDNENNNKNIEFMKLSYLKLIFTLIISLYSTNKHDFENNNFNEYLTNIYEYHDLLIEKYINQIYYITFDPKIIVFLTGFCFNINSVINILTFFAQKDNLKEEFHYNIFIEEISEIFIEFKEKIFIEIAKSTKILYFLENNKNIDLILKKYLDEDKNGIIKGISDEDNLKIEQVKYLFVNKFNEINNETIHEYIIKLCLKFISNYKFKELKKLIDETFKKDLINTDLNNIENIINKIEKNEINNIINEITYYFIQLINDSFFEYYKIKLSQLNFNNDLSKKSNSYLNNYLMKLNKLIKLIINNDNYLYNLKNFLNKENENMYENDFLKIISDWSYQSVKWIVDLFYDKLIENEKDNEKDKGLKLTIEGILFKDEMFEKYYIFYNNFGNINDNYLNKEKKFFDYLGKYNNNILELLYKITTISKSYLCEIMDENLSKQLGKDIDKEVEYIDYNIEI